MADCDDPFAGDERTDQSQRTAQTDRSSSEDDLAHRYHLLANDLQAIEDERIKSGDPNRVAGVMQLAKVVHFLRADPSAARCVGPLTELFADLHDVAQGAQPKRLPLAGRTGTDGRPTNLFTNLWKGQLIEAVDVLISGGMSPREATGWVVAELRKRKIPVPRARIEKWRERANSGEGPEATGLIRDELKRDRPDWPASLDQADAKQHATKLLDTLRSLHFP